MEAPLSPFDPDFQPEDYTTMLYNLHSWSYRVSRREFQLYQQRRVQQLRHQLGLDDISHRDVIQTHSFSGKASFRKQTSSRGSRAFGSVIQSSFRPTRRQQASLVIPQDFQQAAGQSFCGTPSFRERSSWWPLNPSPKTLSWMCLPMLPATHKVMLAWAVLMLVTDLVYTAILLPLFVAFELNSYGHSCFWVSIVVGWLFVADFLVVLHR